MLIGSVSSFSVYGTIFDVRLALEVIAAIFAVRVYRLKRTTPFRLLQYALLFLAVPQVCLFIFTGAKELVLPALSRFAWIYWADPVSVLMFLALLSLSLRSFLYEPSGSGDSNV